MLADEYYMLHVTAGMLREMHIFCVNCRMTVHRYVLRKTDKCGSVTQPCTLHRNTVCVWDYGCFYNNIFKFMIKFFVRLVTLFLINSFISSAGLYLYTRLIPKTSDMHGIDRSATAIAQILNNYTQHQRTDRSCNCCIIHFLT